MMGLGYLGSSSSSSSSSNLSPLAPPFTVDRSNQNKPVLNSNLISHLNDPAYGVPYTSSWPYSHSSSGRQNFLADSPRTSGLPSNESGYINQEQLAGNWSGLNSNGKHGLEQINPGLSSWSGVYPSQKLVTDSFSYNLNLNETKPFYPPYASSVNKDDIPLVSETSYDLLSTCHGDETSQVDYTRSLSGLEYKDRVWSGLPEGNHVKTHDSFFSEEAGLTASLAYNNFLNQGGYGRERSSKSKDDPSLFYYADIIRRANKSGDANKQTTTNNEFRAFPMFSESHPLIQSPEGNNRNTQNPYGKRYHMFDDHMSSSLVIKPPAKLSSLNINDVVVGSHKPLKEKGFQIGTTDDAAPPSFEQIDQLNFQFKAQVQVPETSIPNVKINPNSFEQIDHHNPAEDSPCWKGAPTSQFLPFEADSPQPPMKKLQTGNAVDSSKPTNNHDTIKPIEEHESTSDANSQTPKFNLPTPETDVTSPSPLPDMKIQLHAAKNVDASGLVKSLYHLSDLLLVHCSNDESALKEHDREALDHVIRNLGVCMSRQVQLPNKGGGYTYGGKSTTSMSHDDEKPDSDVFGKNVEKLVEHTSLRVEAYPETMVQAIKKVFDENLECKVEVPSLYKNLWLEAEAELCSLSFRRRFERLKKETNSDAASAIKEISTCNGQNIPPKVSMTHSDDVDAGVMARFNILKLREQPNPLNLQVAGVKVGNSQPSQVTVVGKDAVDPFVMDRFSILKRRGDLNADDVEEKHVRDFQDEVEEEEEEEAVGLGSGGGSDWEHILKDDFSWRLS